MPRKSADTVIRRFVCMLPVRLSSEELRERGSMLAHQHDLADKHEVEASETKKRLKFRAETIEAEASRLAEIIRAKQEPREVEVEVRLTKKAGEVEEVRIDTGEIIITRKMLDSEAQTDLLDAPHAWEVTAKGKKDLDEARE